MRKWLPVVFGVFALAALAQGAESVSLTNLALPSLEAAFPAGLPSLSSTSLLGMASSGGYVPDDKYKLRPGDKVSLQIVEDREVAKSLVVADSGEVDVPYLGRVAAVDKTCKQLAEELKGRLEKAFFYRATVVLALDTANKLLGRVYVIGQVRNQSSYEMQVNENLTAAKAILRAGGLGDFANKKKVKVVRASKTPGGTNQTFIVNMAEILEEGKTEKDIPLEPDDFVIVPTRLINF
jgi:protein involved in polysaccharide export with SLBB domain